MARRIGAAIMVLFAFSLCAGTLSVPVSPALHLTVGYLCPTVFLAFAVLLLRTSAASTPLLLGAALSGVLLIAVLDIVTHDVSAGAQIVLSAPVMFAASQLRPGAAILSLIAAIAAELAVVLVLREQDTHALSDISYVSGTLITLAILLMLSSRRQYRLLTQLGHQAGVDPLTGLVTRRILDAAVTSALNTAAAGTGTALLLIDIDHFKDVNDNYGHPVGDDALAHVAAVLRAHVRSGAAVISRLGGDEIAVLLPGCGLEAGQLRAQEMVDAVLSSPLILPGDQELRLSVSAGVGYSAGNSLGLRQLYAAADASLYDAKRSGRGRVGPARDDEIVPALPPATKPWPATPTW